MVYIYTTLHPVPSPYVPGIPIRTTMDNATTVQYAALLHQLAGKTKTTVRDLDPTNELSFLRIRTQKHEIMVAPGERGEWTLRRGGREERLAE